MPSYLLIIDTNYKNYTTSLFFFRFLNSVLRYVKCIYRINFQIFLIDSMSVILLLAYWTKPRHRNTMNTAENMMTDVPTELQLLSIIRKSCGKNKFNGHNLNGKL